VKKCYPYSLSADSDWPLDHDLVQVFAADLCVMLGYADEPRCGSPNRYTSYLYAGRCRQVYISWLVGCYEQLLLCEMLLIKLADSGVAN